MMDFTEGGDDFPCPCCGVTLQFYARWGKRECPGCGWKASLFQTTEQTIEPPETMHLHYSGGGGLSKAAVQVTCSHCHTAVVFEPPTVLTQCPCCRSAIATPPQTPSPSVCPTGIVPFALDAEAATACIQRWIAKLPVSLTPRVKLSQLQQLQGVYLPFWIFDAYTIAQYRGDRADYQAIAQTHTEINDWGEAERKTRYIRRKQWSGRSGQVSRFFDEVPIAATPFIPPHQLENLEFSRLLESWRPYDPAYLQGYVTLASRLLPQAALERAKDLMASTLHADAIRQMGGDEQRLEHLSLRYPALSFKQVLLPVWLGTYRDRHQVYRVLVNGRTGAIVGDVPNHSLKLTVALVLSVAIAMANLLMFSLYFATPSWLPKLLGNHPPAMEFEGRNPSTPGVNDLFRQGVNLAMNAAKMTQSAQTVGNWKAIALQWQEASALMQAVPASSPNANRAQVKAIEYQQNADYARQQAQKLAYAPPPPPPVPLSLSESAIPPPPPPSAISPSPSPQEVFRYAVNQAMSAARQDSACSVPPRLEAGGLSVATGDRFNETSPPLESQLLHGSAKNPGVSGQSQLRPTTNGQFHQLTALHPPTGDPHCHSSADRPSSPFSLPNPFPFPAPNLNIVNTKFVITYPENGEPLVHQDFQRSQRFV